MSSRSLACAFSLAAAISSHAESQAKGPKRCDWHGALTTGESPYVKCMDLATDYNGKTFTVPKNVTRISADGFSFCQPKTPTTGAGDADIVFIYDNSGSMTADALFVGAGNDTSFFFQDYSNNNCTGNAITGQANYRLRDGSPWTVNVLAGQNNCGGAIAGDPYQARGSVIKEGVDYLAATSPTSTAGVMAFNSKVDHEVSPKPVNNAAAMAALKASIVLDTSGGTLYGPPLTQAKDWLTDAAIIKTSKQAIIFITDGEPNKYDYMGLVDARMPPIYTIYMAKDDASNQATTRLQELATESGGTYTRVNPKDPAAFVAILKTIISTITKNTLPKATTVTNKSLAPPQTSQSVGITANPDGGAFMKLDSIIGLKLGKNEIEVKLTRDDNSASTYNFTLDVAGEEIGTTGGKYSCYDMPTLAAIDKATNLPAEIYSPTGNSYQLKLTRSPSELGDVTVAGGSATGDKEGIKVGNTDMRQGFPIQTGDFSYNPNKANPSVGNGILDVADHGDLTFAWSHPRDSRETVSFVLPGRVVPIIDGGPDISIKKPVTEGIVFDPAKVKDKDPVIVTDPKGKCIVNCVGTSDFHVTDAIPTWNLNLKSPIKYKIKIFDNLGQFVCSSSGEINAAAWAALAKTGDSATVHFKILPVSQNGQQLGTGAYLMRAEVSAQGDQVTKNSAGETIVVKNAHREYFKRFGYIRAF